MSKRLCGTCSLCGGAVTQEIFQYIVGAPMPPRCERCGAKPKRAHGPIIDMDPGSRRSDERERKPKLWVRGAA